MTIRDAHGKRKREERRRRRDAKRMSAAGGARKNAMLICEPKGPNAKYMLYPYYATMIATSSGTFISADSDTAVLALTDRQPACT